MNRSWFKLGILGHLILTYGLFFYYHSDNLQMFSSVFVPVIGADENYWLEVAECYYSKKTESWISQCFFGLNPNLWPIFLAISMLTFGKGFIWIVTIKCLIYICTIIFLFNMMQKAGKPWLKTFFYFLCLNPYILVLHNTLLRDDVIVSLLLLVVSFFWHKPLAKDAIRLFSFKTIFLFAIILTLFWTRVHFGLIAMVFVTIRFSLNTYFRSGSPFFIIFFAFVYFMLGFLTINYFRTFIGVYDYGYSLSHILRGIYEMLYSPLPTNILNGKVFEIDSGIEAFWPYAFIFPTFSFLVTVFAFFIILYKINPFYSHFKDNMFVTLFVISLMIPYVISVHEIQGPRQSLPSTILLFYVFGLPFCVFLFKVLKINGGASSSNNLLQGKNA